MSGERHPITVAVCSNRPWRLEAVRQVQALLGVEDKLVMVIDGVEASPAPIVDGNDSPQVEVIAHPRTLGLSACRNEVIAHSKMRYVLFIDDDVVLTGTAFEAIRDGLRGGGVHALGVRLERPTWLVRLPWWMTEGQVHYLGVHAASPPFSIWGGCMAIDVDFARRQGIAFRPELGRIGSLLQSGDDSTFVADISRLGGTTRFLNDSGVVHNFSADRVRFRYLARRVFWQGRSEVRRSNLISGIAKEYRRYRRNSGSAFGLRGLVASLLCLGLWVTGAAWEYASRGRPREDVLNQFFWEGFQ
jgi:glucosyl-dolichyl phosphate glucuronosyltransferase